MKLLSGRRAWITGASSGIGEATAKALAALGAEVVLSARRVDRLNRLAAAIGAAGGKVLLKPVDVAERTAVETLAKELEALGGVDILVNNAGVMHLSPLIKGRVDEWERIIDVNIKGVLYCINAVLPGMAARQAHPLKACGTGGRAIRQHGNIWDHFSVTYWFPNDVSLMFHSQKGIPGVKDEIRCRIFGSRSRLQRLLRRRVDSRPETVRGRQHR